MKKTFYLAFVAFLFANCLLPTANCFSQSPNAINYQAVARNASGNPVANTNIGVTFKIWKTDPTIAGGGSVIYEEDHSSVTTNQFGLFNLVIASGSIVSGNFPTIAWGSDSYFLEVYIDADAGGPGPSVSMGATQFVSVPYAIHAGTADSLTGGSAASPWKKIGNKISPNVITDSVGIGTASPENKFGVAGNVAIGAGYAGFFAAPINGMLIEGDLGIGINAALSGKLHVKETGSNTAGFFQIQNVGNNNPAVSGTTTGAGRAGRFMIQNGTSGATSLEASTFGSGNAIYGLNSGTGKAGLFQITSGANASDALVVTTVGTGKAANFSISNGASAADALTAGTNGAGTSLFGITTGSGSAGIFQVSNGSNANSALRATTNGTGRAAEFSITNGTNTNPVLQLSTNSASGKILQFGNDNQPTREWMLGVDGAANLSLINENNGTPFTSMQISNNGDMRIGTFGSPLQRLSVDGSFAIIDANGTFQSIFKGGIQSDDLVYTLPPSHNGGGSLQNDGSGTLTWQPAADPWLESATEIYPNLLTKNVGIGTSSPGERLDVAGGSIRTTNTTNTTLTAYSTDAGSVSYLSLVAHDPGSVLKEWRIVNTGASGGRLHFFDGPSGLTRMIIDETGNVGIGTTGPGAKLDIAGTTKLGTGGNSFAGLMTGVLTIDPPSLSAGQISSPITITLTGVNAGDRIFLTPPTSMSGNVVIVGASILSANQVTVVVRNVSLSGADELPTNCPYIVIKP